MSHVDVRRDAAASRYIASIDGAEVGFIEFFAGAGVVELLRTEVDPTQRGKGIASVLVRHALDDIRDQLMQVLPVCDYVQTWIEHHPDYADLVVKAP